MEKRNKGQVAMGGAKSVRLLHQLSNMYAMKNYDCLIKLENCRHRSTTHIWSECAGNGCAMRNDASQQMQIHIDFVDREWKAANVAQSHTQTHNELVIAKSSFFYAPHV